MSDLIEVVILMGGSSSERDVSLVTGRAVMEAIDTSRFRPRPVDLRLPLRLARVAAASGGPDTAGTAGGLPVEEEASLLLEQIAPAGVRPDVVFIALHGRYGEDGCVQGLLELLQIPYTGSGVLASALAMDKIATKRLLRSCGLPTPRWTCSDGRERVAELSERVRVACGYPCIVKPNREGSTVGASIVRGPEDLEQAVQEALRYDRQALIEELVSGTEVTVGILQRGDELLALPVVEIRPPGGFYDYRAKYTAGLTEKVCPAPLPQDVTAEVQRIALETHRLLGCSGMSRVDLFVTADGPTVLEVNTIPGLTPTSLLPRAAQAARIPFSEMITMIIESGLAEGVR